jgi:hypothetical protein
MIGVIVALLLGAGVVLGSRVRYGAEPEDARIRFSWRALGERVEECRAPTPEELAGVPPHMRMREICERRLRPFRLEVRIDGALALDEEVRPSGAREDRPAYVFHELSVRPGPHRVQVLFAMQGGAAAGAPLELDARITLAPGEIALVTRNDADDRLAITLPPR